MVVVFLDRDGVINRKPVDGHYVTRWEEFEFLPRAKKALELLKSHGFHVVVVTNQRGVALGHMTEADVKAIHERMSQSLAESGAAPDAVYFCPHEIGACTCRKPGIGLFLKAKERWPDLRFEDSFVIGDTDADIEAGVRVGACTIRITSDDQTDRIRIRSDFLAKDLWDAVVHHVVKSD